MNITAYRKRRKELLYYAASLRQQIKCQRSEFSRMLLQHELNECRRVMGGLRDVFKVSKGL